MPNIATVFKAEIQRLARKEVKVPSRRLHQSTVSLKRTIAAIRKRVTALEKATHRLVIQAGKFQGRPVTEEGESDVKRRFSAKGVRSLRRRLKVSQAEFAKLLGVSAQAVYLWEGKSGPLALRQETRKALANLRGLGRREIKKMLEGTPASPKGKPGPKPKGKKGRKRGRKPRAKK